MKTKLCVIEGSVHDPMHLSFDDFTIIVDGIDTEGDHEINLDGRWVINEILKPQERLKMYQAGPYENYYVHYELDEETYDRILKVKEEYTNKCKD